MAHGEDHGYPLDTIRAFTAAGRFLAELSPAERADEIRPTADLSVSSTSPYWCRG